MKRVKRTEMETLKRIIYKIKEELPMLKFERDIIDGIVKEAPK